MTEAFKQHIRDFRDTVTPMSEEIYNFFDLILDAAYEEDHHKIITINFVPSKANELKDIINLSWPWTWIPAIDANINFLSRVFKVIDIQYFPEINEIKIYAK